MPLHWGIASCCKASHDFANAIKSFSEEDHVLVSLASVNADAAQDFSRKYQIPNVYGDYDSMATDNGVDIVYIAVNNSLHFDITKCMLSNGKHVICEKPMGFNEKHAKELMILSKIKKVFLMEAMWSKCFPSIDFLGKELEEGVIGEVLYVQVTFGRASYNKKNLNLKEMYRGAVMDFGIHALSFQEQIFKNIIPTKLLTTGHLSNQDVDESASCIINYPDGKTVVISVHSRCDLPNEAVVVGTKGSIKIPHFWFPTKIIMPDGLKYFPLPDDASVVSRSIAFRYLIMEVQYCIEKGLLESEKHSHASTLQIMHWLDLWRKQMEVIYENE